jgi:hypothetical protein
VNAAANGNHVVITDDPSTISDISFIISVERPSRSRKTLIPRNMRGRDISHMNVAFDALFPWVGETKPYLTIGVGDGGNEAGTGNIADDVARFVPFGEDICVGSCCDVLVMAGVSNWGAIAIAAAVVIQSHDSSAAQSFLSFCNGQRAILKKMVDAFSFDGCTGKVEESIDGMRFENEHTTVTDGICQIVKSVFAQPL